MPSYTYWRLNVIDNGNSILSIAEIKFFDGTSTQIPTTGGTASADDQSVGAAANAFDGNASTAWATGSAASPTSPHWIQYQFASAVDVATYSIAVRNDSLFNCCPDSWSLQGSNDGSTWTTIGNYSAVWSSAGQSQTFTVGAYGLGDAYRLLITAAAAGGVVGLTELVFKDSGGSAISLTNGAASASSNFYSGGGGAGGGFACAQAFDGNTAKDWASLNTPSGGSPEWIAYRFVGAASVASFTITARNDPGAYNQAPQSFSLQKSTDGGATWTTVESYTAGTWTQGSSQTFTVSAAAPAPQPVIFVVM